MQQPGRSSFALAIAVLTISALLPWPYAQGAGPVIPGVSLADIPLGTPIAEAVQWLGAPSAVRLVSADGTLAYTFQRYGITAYTRANIIFALTTTNSVVGTAGGIGMGAPREAVVAAFGAPAGRGMVEGFPGVRYDAQGIAFGFDQNSVAAVMVFAPTRAAAPPSRPAPLPSPQVTSRDTPREIPVSSAGIQRAGGVTLPAPDGSVTAGPGATTLPPAPQDGDALAGFPDVSHLRPYTAETRYLSLAGYLRYLVFAMSRQWVGPVDAEQVVRPAGNP